MKSKLLFFILVLLTFLLLPIGVKSRPKEAKLLKENSLKILAPAETGNKLKGISIDSDYLNDKTMV
jgi:hypothetical protein